MAEVVRDKQTGEYFVRAGANQLYPITEEQVPIAQENDIDTFFNSIGNSLGQLGTGAAALAGSDRAQQRFDQFQQTQQVRNESNPIAGVLGSVTPDVVAGVATGGMAGAGSTALRTAGRQALVTGVTEGALGAARNPRDPIVGAMMQGGAGAVLGGAAPMVTRFTQSAQGVVNGSRRAAGVEAPQALAAQGYRDPWYAGRGEAAKQVGAAVESFAPVNLITGAGKRAADNQQALNRTVMQDIYVRRPDKAAGVQSQVDELGTVSPEDGLTPGFFEAAEERFKQDYQDLGQRISGATVADELMKDPQLNTQLHDIAQSSVTSVVKNSDLDAILTRVIDRIDNGMSSQALLDMRSDLSRYATQQATSASGDKAAAQTVSEVVQAIDSATERALTKFGADDVVDDWKDITRRYMVMQSALEGRAVDIASGNVNARTLMNNLSKPRRKSAGQKTPTFEATRHFAGNASTGIPDSGTATRQLMNSVLTGAAAGGGIAIAN